jgi:hypothetical protein
MDANEIEKIWASHTMPDFHISDAAQQSLLMQKKRVISDASSVLTLYVTVSRNLSHAVTHRLLVSRQMWLYLDNYVSSS